MTDEARTTAGRLVPIADQKPFGAPPVMVKPKRSRTVYSVGEALLLEKSQEGGE